MKDREIVKSVIQDKRKMSLILEGNILAIEIVTWHNDVYIGYVDDLKLVKQKR